MGTLPPAKWRAIFRRVQRSPYVVARRVGARQRGEVNTGQGFQQPGGLVILLDRPACSNGGSPAFHRTAVDPDPAEQVRLEIHARVALDHIMRLFVSK